MGVLTTGVECFLCSTTVPYDQKDRSHLLDHLGGKHCVRTGADFVITGCVMTAQEREAVRKVVESRPPKLVSLNESSKVVLGDAATVEDNVTSKPEIQNKNCDTDKEEKEASPPVETSSRRFTCMDCNISFKLQIQLNRHKKHCIKKEPGSSIASPVKKPPVFVPLSPGSIKTEPDTARRHSLPAQTSDLLAQHPGLQLKRTSLPNKPSSPVLKPSLTLKPTSSLMNRSSPSKTSPSKTARGYSAFKKGSNWKAPSPGKGFSCTECGKAFVTKAKMNSHFVDIHQPGEFPCPGVQCGKMFTSKNKQQSHFYRHCNKKA